MASSDLHLGHLGNKCPLISEYTFRMRKLHLGHRMSRNFRLQVSCEERASFCLRSGDNGGSGLRGVVWTFTTIPPDVGSIPAYPADPTNCTFSIG